MVRLKQTKEPVIPLFKNVTLKTTFFGTNTVIPAGETSYGATLTPVTIHLNDCHDPMNNSSVTQPYGWDTLKNLYTNYRVTHSSLLIEVGYTTVTGTYVLTAATWVELDGAPTPMTAAFTWAQANDNPHIATHRIPNQAQDDKSRMGGWTYIRRRYTHKNWFKKFPDGPAHDWNEQWTDTLASPTEALNCRIGYCWMTNPTPVAVTAIARYTLMQKVQLRGPKLDFPDA